MDNITDALLMAGQALIFIVALTVCISSFSTVRSNIDSVIGQTETVQFVKGTQGYLNFIEGTKDNAVRVVGVETVMSSIHRCEHENYTIYIEGISNWNDGVMQKNNPNKKIEYITGEYATYFFNKTKYDIFSKYQYREYLGEYQEPTSNGVSTENKEIHRVITYEAIN